jgi:hypothetical protein
MSARIAFGISSTVVVLIVAACGADESVFKPAPPPSEPFDAGPPAVFPPPQEPDCVGLECAQAKCDPGAETTVTGTVMAPNGTLPLYNVIVYVPNAPVDPIGTDLKCDRCGTVSGKPLVSTLSGTDGKFELKNVPAGTDIPLVMQVGKWRRQVKLPKVDPCVANAVADVNLTRLPKSQAEGDLPKIAVTTGRCDQLACLLPKLGLDASEFTPNTGTGRLHLYKGAAHDNGDGKGLVPAPAPANTPNAATLWANKDSLSRYDMVLLSCECGEKTTAAGSEKPAAAKQAMYDYAAAGGRIFASHFHYTWADTGPLHGAADWNGNPNNPENPQPPYLVDRSFAKGDALANWLVTVEASNVLGEIPISQPRQNVGGVIAPTQRWVYRETGNVAKPQATKYLSVNTPVEKPAAEQCGKFVYADMHLYAGDVQPADNTALPNDAFPTSCSPTLTPEEKALAFLFFDLSSCIQDDTKPPTAPR